MRVGLEIHSNETEIGCCGDNHNNNSDAKRNSRDARIVIITPISQHHGGLDGSVQRQKGSNQRWMGGNGKEEKVSERYWKWSISDIIREARGNHIFIVIRKRYKRSASMCVLLGFDDVHFFFVSPPQNHHLRPSTYLFWRWVEHEWGAVHNNTLGFNFILLPHGIPI